MTSRSRFARWSKRLGAAAIAATVLKSGLADPAAAAPEGTIRDAGEPNRIKDGYIVVFKDTSGFGAARPAAVPGLVDREAKRYGAKVGYEFRYALRGFSATMTEERARRLAADPDVAYVEQEGVATLETTPWGLDRIDQTDLPLDGAYNVGTTAANVTAYVIDTGIRTTHQEFGGRATFGASVFDNGNDGDCDGHGTHVAGVLGGAGVGVARGVRLVSVKVFACLPGGGVGAGSIAAAVDWVTGHHVAGQPAVANMSLSWASDAVNQAVSRSIADGITYVVAAGNEAEDACSLGSNRAPGVISVGYSDINDSRPDWTNYGPCVDIFAPGDAWSASHTGDSDYELRAGTSISAPHVAGAAALLLSRHPYLTPAEVKRYILAAATRDRLQNVGPGSPNLLLNTRNIENLTFDPPVLGTGAVFKGGDLQVLTVNSAGQLRHFSRTPNNQWTETATGVTEVTGSPAAVVGPDGLLHAFVVRASGGLQEFTQDATGWHPGPMIGEAMAPGVGAVARDAELHVLATGQDGKLWYFRRDAAGLWSMTQTSQESAGTPAITMRPGDGPLVAYVVEPNDQVGEMWNDDDSWRYVGNANALSSSPGLSAVWTNDGPHLLAVSQIPSHSLMYLQEAGRGHEYDGWDFQYLGSNVGPNPALVIGPDGLPHAFGADATGDLRQYARDSHGAWAQVTSGA